MPLPAARVTRSKDTARATYNRLSRWYDALAGGSEAQCVALGLAQLRPQAGERLLEIGFGTGRSLVALAQAVGASGRVAGVDLSDGMLKKARARLEKAGLAERVELKNGDAARLPFEADAFDAVFMSFTLELFDTPEIGAVLGECRRVLRGGGRIGVAAMSSEGGRPGVAVRLYAWARAILPAIVDCRPIPVSGSLAAAGFQVVEAARQSIWGLPVAVVTAQKS